MKHKKLNRELESFFVRLLWWFDSIVILLIIFVIMVPAPSVEVMPRHIERVVFVEPKSERFIIDTIKLPKKNKKAEIEPQGASDDVFTDDELTLMARVVHAEAGNQDIYGRRLVAAVILNRLESATFPDTVAGVVYQSDQFAISKSYKDEDMLALKAEIESRTDSRIVCFRTGRYHSFGEPAYQYGNHYFSTLE